MVLKTPIVLLIFRRPELTAKVFDRIREAKPQQLFVVADGPRNEEEAIKCEKARSVTEAIDWDCEVKRNYSPTNLGCKQRVTSGLDWVFSQVDRAIILEDDCLPHPDFFSFCQELLDRYEQDDRVWVITGNNFQNGKKRGNGSYYFSKYNHIWGWATWKRAWEHNEPYIPFWQEWKNSQAWRNHTPDRIERQYWSDIFEQMYERKIDTWDYTWTASVWYGGGLTATPNVNLVTNIGIGPDATHTIVDEWQEGIPVEAIGEIIHPQEVKQNRKADRYVFNTVFSHKSKGLLSKLLIPVGVRANMKVVIRRLINALGYEVSRTSNTKCSSKSGQIRFPADFEQKNIEIIKLVQESTMTSIERINSLINAVQYIVSNNLEGTIVECGVWRGGSMMAIAYALQDLSDVKRDLFLFDTYEGMSPPTNKDIAHFNVDAQTLLNSKDEKEREAYFCYASLEDVQKNLRSTGYPRDKIHFIRGKVEDTIPEQAPDKIALLRLDTDWYESTRHELEHLFPRLVPGGVIIIDDYGYWKGCKQATDEYIQNNRIPILLNRIDLTGRIGIKLPTQHH